MEYALRVRRGNVWNRAVCYRIYFLGAFEPFSVGFSGIAREKMSMKCARVAALFHTQSPEMMFLAWHSP